LAGSSRVVERVFFRDQLTSGTIRYYTHVKHALCLAKANEPPERRRSHRRSFEVNRENQRFPIREVLKLPLALVGAQWIFDV
jgi:hypothetical protein